MIPMEILKEFCDIIDTYGGRDKVMKALCYSTKLMAGYYMEHKPELAKSYATASSRLSNARATLRLIDDIPMIQYTLEYGWGKNENDQLMAILGVCANIVDLIFYPVEKICWLSENNVIKISNYDYWNNVNTICWVLSVYLNFIRTLRNFSINQKKLNKAQEQEQQIIDESLLKKHRLEVLSLIRLSLDFVHAVNYLPKGHLWGGKFSTFQIGAIGTISATLGLYQIIAKRNLCK